MSLLCKTPLQGTCLADTVLPNAYHLLAQRGVRACNISWCASNDVLKAFFCRSRYFNDVWVYDLDQSEWRCMGKAGAAGPSPRGEAPHTTRMLYLQPDEQWLLFVECMCLLSLQAALD